GLLSAMEEEANSLKVANEALEEELQRVSGLWQETLGELEKSKGEVEGVRGELAEVKDQYERVKVRYEKLIKPARTPKGKRVAEVQYIKSPAGAVQLLF